jgi:hypothetical protein
VVLEPAVSVEEFGFGEDDDVSLPGVQIVEGAGEVRGEATHIVRCDAEVSVGGGGRRLR